MTHFAPIAKLRDHPKRAAILSASDTRKFPGFFVIDIEVLQSIVASGMPAECLDAAGGAQPGSPCAQTIKSEAFEAARRARAAKNRAKIGVPA